MLQGNLGEEIEKLRKKLTEQQFSYEQRLRLLKLDHENQLKVQERLLTERADEERKRMEDRFQTEMENMELRYKNRIK